MKPVYQPENARIFRERIRKAETLNALAALDKSLERLWKVGAFRAGEMDKLDAFIMERIAKFENRKENA